MVKQKLGVSIVIPCFNEAETIALLLQSLKEIVPNSSYNIEIIIVDGCSTDSTPKILEKAFLDLDHDIFSLVLMKERLGYGNDIMEGLRRSRYEYMSWTHADLQTDPSDVIKGINLLKLVHSEKIIIKGERKSRKILDVILTFAMQVVVFLVLRVNLSDINAQPKIFPRRFYDNILEKEAPTDFSLDLFLLYQAKKNKYEIISFPVEFKKRQLGIAKGGGGSLVNRWNLIKRTLKYIFKLREELNNK